MPFLSKSSLSSLTARLRLQWLGLVIASVGTPSFAQTTPTCHTEQVRHDRVEIRCPWPGAARRLRFDAHLAGSHDDTTATLAATLNGAPLACAPGNKTSIDGQDEGDVTLSCQLTAPSAATGTMELRFNVRWYHARYSGFDLRVEPGG